MKALDQHTLQAAPSNCSPSIRSTDVVVVVVSLFLFFVRFHKLFIHKIYVDFYLIVLFSFLFSCSLGPLETLPREMVSRRKILSRSRDDLNLEHHHHQYVTQDDEEDIWYQKDKLYKVSSNSYSSHYASICTHNTKRTQFLNRPSRTDIVHSWPHIVASFRAPERIEFVIKNHTLRQHWSALGTFAPHS